MDQDRQVAQNVDKEDEMTFGKRIAAPSEEARAELDACPHCRGTGTVRARGQRKVCLPCKGTGKKPDA
jgi:DnaJ-class molecular chaperone